MSYKLKMMMPLVGMFLLGCAAVWAVMGESRQVEQPLPQSLDDLAAVRLIEVKDAGGQIVLSGSFTVKTKPNGDSEGNATLAATGVDADATGESEFEVSKKRDGSVGKELEVEVHNLAPGASFSLFVDGQQVAVFKTDPRGRADLEMSNRPSS